MTTPEPVDTIAAAFLDAIAVGEDYDPKDYDELVGGDHFEGFDAFPQWNGRRFATGISHAAGRYQFEPATWRTVAGRYGLTDFTPHSQDLGAWQLARDDYRRRTGRDLRDDLKRRNFGRLVSGLRPTWSSIGPSMGDRYLGALAARRVLGL